MALVTLNLKPTDKQLREFGLIALIALCLIGTMLWWLNRIEMTYAAAFAGCGIVLFILSRIRTGIVKPVYQGMMLVTFPIGWMVSHIVMAIFFYGIITLTGLVFKLIGRDPLRLSYDRQAETYWVVYRQKRAIKDYFNQF